MTDYINKLRQYYDQENISASPKFKCVKYEDCHSKENKRNLIKGAEAYVGSKYGIQSNIRIILISMDTGGSSVNANDGYGENLEQRNKRFEDDSRNSHMLGTKHLLELIYSELKKRRLVEETDYNHIKKLYSMINSAKCSAIARTQNNLSTAVNRQLYVNCSEFTIGELEILKPNIIITQGNYSKIAVNSNDRCHCIPESYLNTLGGSIQVQEHLTSILKEYVAITTIAGSKVPIIYTPHPASRALWHKFKDFILPLCVHTVIDLYEQYK